MLVIGKDTDSTGRVFLQADCLPSGYPFVLPISEFLANFFLLKNCIGFWQSYEISPSPTIPAKFREFFNEEHAN